MRRASAPWDQGGRARAARRTRSSSAARARTHCRYPAFRWAHRPAAAVFSSTRAWHARGGGVEQQFLDHHHARKFTDGARLRRILRQRQSIVVAPLGDADGRRSVSHGHPGRSSLLVHRLPHERVCDRKRRRWLGGSDLGKHVRVDWPPALPAGLPSRAAVPPRATGRSPSRSPQTHPPLRERER